MEIPSNEPEPRDLALTMGFVRDLIEVGQTGSDLGFHAFQLCTKYGFRLVRNCLMTPAEMADVIFGGNDISNTLRNVHTTVDAAEVIAITSILMAQSAASIGFSAADVTLEIGGVQRSENGILHHIRAAIPSRYTEYTPFIQQIAEMILTFITPIRDIPPPRLRQILVSYALLQQANRPIYSPLSNFRSTTFVIPPDLVRCMGYAAAAYGHMTVNCLEFIPRGIYQSDILPLLVPGVTQHDVICEAEVVNPFCTGYLLVSDHRDHHIVLSIRGSLNLNDLITDLTCKPADCSTLFAHLAIPSCSFQEEQRFPEQDLECLCHEGFLRAACYLDQLLREVVMESLRKYPNYTVLLCGHSLGAGVAALLTLIWSQIFLGVRCVCLGPPCLLSLSASRRVDSLITSVIIDDDFVSRLSLGSCYDLRDACLYLHSTQLTESITSEINEQNISLELSAAAATTTSTETCPSDIESAVIAPPSNIEEEDRTLTGIILSQTEYYRPLTPHSSLYQYPSLNNTPQNTDESNPIELFEYSRYTLVQPTPQLKEIEEQRQVTLRSLGYLMDRLNGVMSSFKLYPPGRIIHIVDKKEWKEMSSHKPPQDCYKVLSDDQSSVAYLCDQEYFSSLQLSGNMFASHLPTEYLTKLRNLFPLTT